MMRELGGVFGIAVTVAVFACRGQLRLAGGVHRRVRSRDRRRRRARACRCGRRPRPARGADPRPRGHAQPACRVRCPRCEGASYETGGATRHETDSVRARRVDAGIHAGPIPSCTWNCRRATCGPRQRSTQAAELAAAWIETRLAHTSPSRRAATAVAIVQCGTHGPLWLPYVEVERIDEVTERARLAGGLVCLEPREGPAGWRSVGLHAGRRRDRVLAAKGWRGDGERELLAAAKWGDEDAFGRARRPYRRELQSATAYRMLGSAADAEDALQDALLGAWRGLPRFEGRSSLRSWLYTIATNACLKAIERRPKRVLPIDYGPPADPHDASASRWSSRCGWSRSRTSSSSSRRRRPEARYEQRESVELAFIAALQHLPARQRAVLILRDVLGFSAREVGEALDTTPTSVDSALQRARKTVDERLPERSQQATLRSLGDAGLRAIVDGYVAAWERADVERDRRHARRGRDDHRCRRCRPGTAAATRSPPLIGRLPLREAWRRLVPTRANGQLRSRALHLGRRRADASAHAIHVIGLDGNRIRDITVFQTPEGLRTLRPAREDPGLGFRLGVALGRCRPTRRRVGATRAPPQFERWLGLQGQGCSGSVAGERRAAEHGIDSTAPSRESETHRGYSPPPAGRPPPDNGRIPREPAHARARAISASGGNAPAPLHATTDARSSLRAQDRRPRSTNSSDLPPAQGGDNSTGQVGLEAPLLDQLLELEAAARMVIFGGPSISPARSARRRGSTMGPAFHGMQERSSSEAGYAASSFSDDITSIPAGATTWASGFAQGVAAVDATTSSRASSLAVALASTYGAVRLGVRRTTVRSGTRRGWAEWRDDPFFHALSRRAPVVALGQHFVPLGPAEPTAGDLAVPRDAPTTTGGCPSGRRARRR